MLQIHATLVLCMIPKAKRIVTREGTACTCVAPRTSGLGCGGFTAAAKSQQHRQTAPRVMRQLAASDHEKEAAQAHHLSAMLAADADCLSPACILAA